MDRLMITAALASPIIIGGGYLTLDSLLASILFEELQDVDAAHAAIPLVQSDGVFHASAAILEPIHVENISFVANLRAGGSSPPGRAKGFRSSVIITQY